MATPSKEEKYKKQDDFWKGIIQKYEDRNIALEKEQLELQERVDQMEASMPAVMAFNMAKLAQDQPDANVDDLVQMPCLCKLKEEPPKTPLQLPDLSNISVFSIEDADIHYMDRIKDLSDQEKKLIDDVNKLRSKEKAMKETKQHMDEIMDTPDKQHKSPVDSRDMQQMNQRLIEENRRLNDDVADLKLELKHTRENVEGPMSRELDRQRRKVMELESQLKAKQDENSNKDQDIQREINFLKSQIESADKNLADMIEINNKLKDELDILNIRAQELQNDLINQKISEANTLALLKAQLKKTPSKSGDNKSSGHGGPGGPGGPGGLGGSSPGTPYDSRKPSDASKPKGHGELYDIARDLSHDLAETTNDDTIPSDLKGTIHEIKELCDLVDQQTHLDGMETTPVKGEKSSVEHLAEDLENAKTPVSSKTPSKFSKSSTCRDDSMENLLVNPPVSSMGHVGGLADDTKDFIIEIPDEQYKPEETVTQHESDDLMEFKSTTSVPQPEQVETPGQDAEITGQDAEITGQDAEITGQEVEAVPKPEEAEANETPSQEEEIPAIEPIPKPPTTESTEIPSQDAEIPRVEPMPKPPRTESMPMDMDEFKPPATSTPNRSSFDPETEKKSPEVTFSDDDVCNCAELAAQSTGKIDSAYLERIEVITELETSGPVTIDTDVKVIKKCTDGLNVTTTVTRSGVLEVSTEGPSGTIETTMTVTMSGNIEVVTEFTESGELCEECGHKEDSDGTDDGDHHDETGDDKGDSSQKKESSHRPDSSEFPDSKSKEGPQPEDSKEQMPVDDENMDKIIDNVPADKFEINTIPTHDVNNEIDNIGYENFPEKEKLVSSGIDLVSSRRDEVEDIQKKEPDTNQLAGLESLITIQNEKNKEPEKYVFAEIEFPKDEQTEEPKKYLFAETEFGDKTDKAHDEEIVKSATDKTESASNQEYIEDDMNKETSKHVDDHKEFDVQKDNVDGDKKEAKDVFDSVFEFKVEKDSVEKENVDKDIVEKDNVEKDNAEEDKVEKEIVKSIRSDKTDLASYKESHDVLKNNVDEENKMSISDKIELANHADIGDVQGDTIDENAISSSEKMELASYTGSAADSQKVNDDVQKDDDLGSCCDDIEDGHDKDNDNIDIIENDDNDIVDNDILDNDDNDIVDNDIVDNDIIDDDNDENANESEIISNIQDIDEEEISHGSDIIEDEEQSAKSESDKIDLASDGDNVELEKEVAEESNESAESGSSVVAEEEEVEEEDEEEVEEEVEEGVEEEVEEEVAEEAEESPEIPESVTTVEPICEPSESDESFKTVQDKISEKDAICQCDFVASLKSAMDDEGDQQIPEKDAIEQCEEFIENIEDTIVEASKTLMDEIDRFDKLVEGSEKESLDLEEELAIEKEVSVEKSTTSTIKYVDVATEQSDRELYNANTISQVIENANKSIKEFLEKAEKEMENKLEEFLKAHSIPNNVDKSDKSDAHIELVSNHEPVEEDKKEDIEYVEKEIHKMAQIVELPLSIENINVREEDLIKSTTNSTRSSKRSRSSIPVENINVREEELIKSTTNSIRSSKRSRSSIPVSRRSSRASAKQFSTKEKPILEHASEPIAVHDTKDTEKLKPEKDKPESKESISEKLVQEKHVPPVKSFTEQESKAEVEIKVEPLKKESSKLIDDIEEEKKTEEKPKLEITKEPVLVDESDVDEQTSPIEKPLTPKEEPSLLNEAIDEPKVMDDVAESDFECIKEIPKDAASSLLDEIVDSKENLDETLKDKESLTSDMEPTDASEPVEPTILEDVIESDLECDEKCEKTRSKEDTSMLSSQTANSKESVDKTECRCSDMSDSIDRKSEGKDMIELISEQGDFEPTHDDDVDDLINDIVSDVHEVSDKDECVGSVHDVTEPDTDADEVCELKKLVSQIKCACKVAENLKGPGFIKHAADFKTTLSALQISLDLFQEKCKTKDVLIDSMKNKLKLHARGKIFDDLLCRFGNPKDNVPDYNRSVLADSLAKPAKEITKFGQSPIPCDCEEEVVKEEDAEECACNVSPEPLRITDIDRIGPTSVLIRWDPSASDKIIGYELCVNNISRAKIFSRTRTTAILDLLDFNENLNIEIYALCHNGKCYPASTGILEISV